MNLVEDSTPSRFMPFWIEKITRPPSSAE